MLLCAAPVFAQSGVRFDSQVTQAQTTTIAVAPLVTVPANPVIAFCNSPASGVPCTNLATTYTDDTLGTPCSTSTQIVLSGTSSCVASPDAENNWGVWVAAGQYTYTINISGTYFGPYYVTAGGSGGSGGTVTSVTSSPPLVSSGGTTPNITCPTCNTSSATIAGSIANQQIAVGTGSNTIAGGSNLTFGGSTLSATAVSVPAAMLLNLIPGSGNSFKTQFVANTNGQFDLISSAGGQFHSTVTGIQLTPVNSTINPTLFQFNGGTSGTASIGVPLVAGSPCSLLLPTTSPTSGQFLSSAAPSGGSCQMSWSATSQVYPSSGIAVSTGSAWASPATSTTVIGLWSGSCGSSATVFLATNGVCETPAGGGNISNTGTPVSGQIAEWTSATVIEGVNTIPCSAEPALNGDTTSAGGSCTTVNVKVNGVSYGASPSTNTVPVVTAPNTVTYEQVPNAALANTSTTVNTQSCTLGSACTIPFQTKTTNNTSQAGLNLITSTANAVGLTVTPNNSATDQVKFEITGGAYTGTASNLSGTPALPNGTTATTQSVGDGTTKLATDAFVLANGGANSGTQYSFAEYATAGSIVSSGPASPAVQGQYSCGYFPTTASAVAPTCPQVGIASRGVGGATTTDTVLYSDNDLPVIYGGSAAVAISLPTPTSLNNAAFFTQVLNATSGMATALTITPAGGWTISGGSTLVIPQQRQCNIFVDPINATNWASACFDAGGWENGTAIPASAPLLKTNSSGQIVSATTLTPSAASGAVTTPIEVGFVSCTQANCATGSGAATALYTTAGGVTALYRVDAAGFCTSTSAAATAIITIAYTGADGSSTAQTLVAGTATCTTLGAGSVGSLNTSFTAKAATAINYYVTIASTPSYQARIALFQESTN